MTDDKYICGYCGAEYASPAARARCELECDEKQKADAERERRRKLEEERQSRLQEIRDARNAYNALVAPPNKTILRPVCLTRYFERISPLKATKIAEVQSTVGAARRRN